MNKPARERSVYVIKGIDPASWQRLKVRAASEGHSIKWVMTQLIQQYGTYATEREVK